MKILNLGVGDKPIIGAVGVDNKVGLYVEESCDLNKIPWKWESGSIDGIYMIHSLEHFRDNMVVLGECYRVLKPSGFLYIQTPHASSLALADLGHFSCYATSTLKRLDGSGYMGIRWFDTVLTRIFYRYQLPNHSHPYVPFLLNETDTNHPILRKLGFPLSWVIQKLIDLSPLLFERFWNGWVGGAEEFVWMGVKV